MSTIRAADNVVGQLTDGSPSGMAIARNSHGFELSVAVETDVGRVRSNNEDAAGSAWLQDTSLFVMVADGMGGHEAGEVASGLAVQVVEEFVGREPNGDPRQRMYDALLAANEAILEEGQRSDKHGMGTTAICLVVKGNDAFTALVGDSRCYHIKYGQLSWRTTDHTRVQMLIDQGQIDEEQARMHPEAGMLTRALGHGRMADGRPLVPDVLADPITLEPGDALVLSSDGLHDLVEDWEIGQMVASKAPSEAAKALVELACDRGGHDNVTVAVIIAGEQASPFDPAWVPPNMVTAEPTYSGFNTDELLPVADLREGGDVDDPTAESTYDITDPSGKKSSPMVWVAIVAVIGFILLCGLLLLAVGAWFLLG